MTPAPAVLSLGRMKLLAVLAVALVACGPAMQTGDGGDAATCVCPLTFERAEDGGGCTLRGTEFIEFRAERWCNTAGTCVDSTSDTVRVGTLALDIGVRVSVTACTAIVTLADVNAWGSTCSNIRRFPCRDAMDRPAGELELRARW